MAFDGYRSPLPPGSRPVYSEPPDQRPQYPAGYPPQHPVDPREVRSRTSSTIPPNGQDASYPPPPPPPFTQPAQPQSRPVNEAVSSAVNNANATSSQLPADLVAQITADVLKRLQAANLENNVAAPSPAPPASYPPPPTARSDSETSTSPTIPSRNIHTPPSPLNTQKADSSTFGSPPPQTTAPVPAPLGSREPASLRPNDRRMPSPGSESSSVDPSPVRPKVSRLSTEKEETPLEKTWGPLFDEDARPTLRLSQFLRGLANHIIRDYEPFESIVVTPVKMIRYYEETKLPNEIYQWCTTFKKSNSKISKMYRDLECQQHLVQDRYDEVPSIPGLTPVGFEKWMETVILAHPDIEFMRLQKAVLDMPISNADNVKERFPKEISRRLFPTMGNRESREQFERAVGVEKAPEPSKMTKAETFSVPRPERRSSPPTASTPNILNLERERNPYSNTPSESAIDDTPLPPNNIERERKPYSSQPGAGKNYDEPLKAPTARPARANSTSKGRPPPVNSNGRPEGSPYPDNRHHRASSTVNPSGPPRRRQRSPSFSVGPDFRRPGEDILGYQPPASLPRDPRDIEEENRRYTREAEQKRAEWARRQAEEDTRSFEGGRDSGRDRYERGPPDVLPTGTPRRGYEEDYYRQAPGRGGGGGGGGYDYNQYPPNYR